MVPGYADFPPALVRIFEYGTVHEPVLALGSIIATVARKDALEGATNVRPAPVVNFAFELEPPWVSRDATFNLNWLASARLVRPRMNVAPGDSCPAVVKTAGELDASQPISESLTLYCRSRVMVAIDSTGEATSVSHGILELARQGLTCG